MGNTPSNSIIHDASSDRELARKLLDHNNKRIKAVQFAESDVSIVEGEPSTLDSTSQSLQARNLRSNLMRVQNDRDPMVYYEIIRVVGVGSMGSVAMVRKRDEMIGGSARRNLVKSLRRQKTANECFRIPILGELLRQCFEVLEPKRNSNHDTSRIYHHQEESITSVNDNESSESGGTKKPSTLYALKSIHLNRVTDDSFVEELKNEIEILKNLVSILHR
jgi:serine/threonine protein kinase